MSYAIIGFGRIDQALAGAIARSGIVATIHHPDRFASTAIAPVGKTP